MMTILAFSFLAVSVGVDIPSVYRESHATIDIGRMLERTETIYRAERKTTTPCFHRSAAAVEAMLKADGFSAVEKIGFPADGKTCYQDKRMPLAWDASVGRLTLLNGGGLGSLNSKIVAGGSLSGVIADFGKEPYNLVKGSTAVASGGVKARLLTESQFLAGADARGAMILLEPNTWPRRNMLTPILDRGGLGFVTDFLSNRFETPDAVQWVNACTENNNWLVDGETRPFVGFSVSPRTGTKLRALAAEGGLEVLVECDGRRYADEIPVVTATVPGESDREFWIIAHLYEPFATDDANGVAAAIELARYFLKRGRKPVYTIRLVHCFEYYGYAAYTDYRGPLKGKVVGGLNTDSLAAMPGAFIRANRAASALPSRLNTALEMVVEGLKNVAGVPRIALSDCGEYYDDLFIADPSVGVPIAGLGQKFDGDVWWHNSLEDMEHIDKELFHASTAVAATFLSLLLDPTEAFAARAAKDCEAYRRAEEEFVRTAGPFSPWRTYAEGVVIGRATRGFPYDYDRIPSELRQYDAEPVAYSPIANIFANADGRKSLARLIRESEFENKMTFDAKTVESYVRTVLYLADWGYLTLTDRADLTKESIVAALRAAGLKEGDAVAVHSDRFAFGHVSGGAETVLAAFREAVGKGGSVLFPLFTDSVVHCGGVNLSWAYRPYDPNGRSFRAALGQLPLEFLRLNPSAPRTADPLYGWTGFGPVAESRPAKPLSALAAVGGKFVYFGTKPGADDFSFRGKGMALVGIGEADGSTRFAAVPEAARTEGRFPTSGASRTVDLGIGKISVFNLKGRGAGS